MGRLMLQVGSLMRHAATGSPHPHVQFSAFSFCSATARFAGIAIPGDGSSQLDNPSGPFGGIVDGPGEGLGAVQIARQGDGSNQLYERPCTGVEGVPHIIQVGK